MLNWRSWSIVRYSRKAFHLCPDGCYGFAYACWRRLAAKVKWFAYDDGYVAAEVRDAFITVPKRVGMHGNGDNRCFAVKGEHAEAAVGDWLYASGIGAASFGKDAEAFFLFERIQSFFDAAVDADASIVVENQVPDGSEEFFIGDEKAELLVFASCDEKKEQQAVDVALMVCGKNEWLVRKVLYAVYAFDEGPYECPKYELADCVHHFNLFCTIRVGIVYKWFGGEDLKMPKEKECV